MTTMEDELTKVALEDVTVRGVRPFVTGELRSAVQPIVYLRLTKPVTDAYSTTLPAGSVVAAQFWGEGRVVLTRFPDGARISVIASAITGEMLS